MYSIAVKVATVIAQSIVVEVLELCCELPLLGNAIVEGVASDACCEVIDALRLLARH